MSAVGHFTRERKYAKIQAACLTHLALAGFFAAILYALASVFPFPGTSFRGEPAESSCAEVAFWFVKNGLGLLACLGSFVTWRALVRIGEIVNPWSFHHEAVIKPIESIPGDLVIIGKDHGYGQLIDVRLIRAIQLEGEARPQDQFEVLETSAIGDVTIRLRRNHRAKPVSPFTVEISRKALF